MNDSRPSTAVRAERLLARPYAINGLQLRNRVVMAPMTREFSPGGIPGENVAAYYARRAAGGVGLIVTEGTYIGHESTWAGKKVPRVHGEEQLAGWKRAVDAVHEAGGTIAAQLWHVGAARDPGSGPVPEADVLSPSGLDLAGNPKGRAMTGADIEAVIAAYAQSAADAERIGFDAVEIHGAHGYLIDEFLWAGTNHRTDAYGGDLASRTRFAAEAVAAVRSAVSPDFPVLFRFSQWKGGAYDARLADTPGQLGELLALLTDAGVDAFHASTRRYWLPEFDGSDLNLAGWTKKLTGKPVVSVGSVGLDREFTGPQGMAFTPGSTGIEKLLDRMENDEFDLIAVGRSLIADPDWPGKVMRGEATEVFAINHLQSLA
ncbi:NADH:flavin oxidoreductase [Glycomyces harbinensis]|uniref:2,4-dienoyl-CoA reductase n=1 Tax=Glycomyces harbinensis TaxID=58114 RepID=A0A1G7A1F6_9ACTN|nr:NADH:flavin oxidoreductase [Glycomyces harbinensis]SDE08610.1 2,4-dienoyl-CoA reductase [Glycomyces harbinensis]